MSNTTFTQRINLRPELDTDLEFLQRVYASSRAEEMKLVPWSDAEKTAFLVSQFALQRHHYREYYPGATFDVIEFTNLAIGRIYVYRACDHFNLMEITVLPEFQRQGIAGRLLENLMMEARAAKLPINLHVEQFNPAKTWYERLGFRAIEDTGMYLKMQWQPEEAN